MSKANYPSSIRTFFWFCLFAFLCSPSTLAQVIQLDETFGVGGKVTLGFAETGLRSSHAYYVLSQASGRIVVSGGHINGGPIGTPGIAACGLTQAGVLDAGFGTAGKILEMNGSEVRATEPLSNDQFLRLINVWSKSVSAGLNRLNSNGSVDGSFVADLNVGAAAVAVSITIRSDGKILVLLRGVGIDDSNWMVRLNANGSRDPSFGINGVSSLNLRRLPRSAIAGLHVFPDNRILLGGYSSTSGGPQGGNVAWAALLDENGHFERRFGLQGVFRLVFPYSIRVSKTLVQPDGKIILVGHARPEMNQRLMMIRLTTRGRLDQTFGVNGIAIAPNVAPGSSDIGHTAELMGDGRIVVAGSYAVTPFDRSQFLIARFSATGLLETHAVTPFTPNFDSAVFDLLIQPDGKVVVVGYTRNPDASADGNLFAIARYTQ